MSQRSSFARHALVAAASVIAVFGVGASSASAATPAFTTSTTIQLSCEYPLMGESLASVNIQTTVPMTAASGDTGPPYDLAMSFTTIPLDGEVDPTAAGLQGLGVATIEGVVRSYIVAGGALDADFDVDARIAKASVPSSPPVRFSASGTIPSYPFRKAGVVSTRLEYMALTLTARDAGGRALTSLSAAQSMQPSDDDPETFDLSCSFPAGRGPEGPLATTLVTPDPAETPTPTPTVTPKPTPTPKVPYAQTTETRLTCEFPLVGDTTDFSVQFQTPLPPSVPVGTVTPWYDFDTKFTALPAQFGGDRLTDRLRLWNVASIDGVVQVPLHARGALSYDANIFSEIAKTTVPASGALTFTAPGFFGELRFTKPGTVTFAVDPFVLVLRAYDKNGVVNRDFAAAQTVPASDDDAKTFDVPCSPAPGWSNLAAQTEVTAATPTPTPTATPTATPTPTPTPAPVGGPKIAFVYGNGFANVGGLALVTGSLKGASFTVGGKAAPILSRVGTGAAILKLPALPKGRYKVVATSPSGSSIARQTIVYSTIFKGWY